MLGSRIALVAAVLALCLASSASPAFAQDEGYAWGEEGGGSTGTGSSTDDPVRIMGFVGAGLGFRLLRNLDMPFVHDLLTPAYVELGGAVFLPGRELRHGASVSVTTNVTSGVGISGIDAASQWVFTPSYNLLLPFNRLLDMTEDSLQLQIRAGVPLVIGAGLDDPTFVDFTFGFELAVAVHFKFLAGIGVYLEVQGDIIGGMMDTVHPFLAADAGLFIDYEVLP